MFYGETNEKQRKIKYNKDKEEVQRIPKKQICANLSSCKYQIIYDVCESLNWKIISNDETNLNCDVLWYDMSQANDVLSRLKNF